jgi:phosphohistidine phosphatase
MGKHLSRLEITPETIFSSPALRALATARLISEELDISPNDVEIMDKLYTFDFMQLLDVINSLPKKLDYVMIVGHNPAMTDLTNYLSGSKIDNVPTCGVVVLKFSPTSWKKIDKNSAELRSFDYPKKLW